MSAPAVPGRLWLVGCGNMGGAMLARWIAGGVLAPGQVVAVDPGLPAAPAGVEVVAEAPDGDPDVLVLAIKPQLLGDVAPALRDARPRLLLSILAGVECDTLASHVGAARIVRAMPNLPVSLGKGVTALYSATGHDETAEALMAPLGLVEWIDDEGLFHAVTALSGSGPGFVYRFIDALARGGVALGLDPDQARRFAVATVDGAAALASASGEPPAMLADRVASPGGTTRAGLDVLDEGGAMDTLVERTLAAAARRSAALAAAAR